MIVYRLSKSRYAKDLSGKGAELVGGRWNSRGVAMLYTAQSIALCVAEVAVHLPLGILPKDYQLIHLEIPDDSAKELKKLPKDWQSFPHPHSTQRIGDDFIKKNDGLALKAPSVAVQGEYNFLLNPNFSTSQLIKIVKVEDFNFDKRLFVR